MKRKKTVSGRQSAIQKNMDMESAALYTALVEIAAESWRFERALEKVLRRMDAMEADRFARQYSYFSTRVSHAMAQAGLTSLDLTGQLYDIGMAVQAINIEEFDEDEPLIITQMIEPVILSAGRVVKTGMVMLGRVAEE